MSSDRDTLRTRIDRRTALRGVAGLVATGATVSTLTGTAAAHFPAELAVDVAPYRSDDTLPRHDRGFVRVAVTNLADVPAGTDASRYRFGPPDVVADGGGATAVRARRVHDVDDDGTDDLVLRFRLSEAAFGGHEAEGELRWDRDESREHGLSGVGTLSFRHDSAERPPTDC
jgi:hypothetical protein